MSTGEVACSYAAMILDDEGFPITADKIATLVKSATINVEAYLPNLFAKLAERKDLGELTSNVGCGGGGAPAAPAAAATAAAPVAEAKKEEPEEDSDDDMGISLFDD